MKHALWWVAIGLVVIIIISVGGCASTERLAVKTELLEKPAMVRCKVERPRECLDAYAVDRLPQGADPVQVNRALRAEADERAACEVRLRAALQGCNDGK